ncbi:MAG: phenylacetate--CoA ligase family protein, partial [Phycisphaerae bacterium]
MIPWLARYIACPLHERLLSRPTFRCVRELERSQWWSPDAIRRLQHEKLRALLRHASVKTPFYRDRLARVGLFPSDIEATKEPNDLLAALPLLDKRQIRSSRDQMLWRDAPGGLFEHNTGGSTGEPLIFYFDRRRQAYDQAARIRTHRWFGVNIGDRELYLWGSPIELNRADRVKRFRDRLFNHRLVDAFTMSPRRMDAYIDAWNRFRPHCLFGYPSSIVRFAEHARSRRRRLDRRALRAVFVTGEVCAPHDRREIADYFEVP